MGWGDLRNKIVEEVKAQGGNAIEIKKDKNFKPKLNKTEEAILKKQEEDRQKAIFIQEAQIYRKDDKFYDRHNEAIYEAYSFLKDIMWRKGIEFRNNGMGYINFYNYAKQTSGEYSYYDNQERAELSLVGLMDIDAHESEEYTTPSDEYNLIARLD